MINVINKYIPPATIKTSTGLKVVDIMCLATPVRSNNVTVLAKEVPFNIKSTDKIERLFNEIKEININLWNIEDKIRICEKNKDFGKDFINLARSVYSTNDKRSKIKSEINKILGSNIREIKEYADY